MYEQITAFRRIEFDAAHRIIGHENKCKLLHGHRYVVEVGFTTKSLDNVGRVIDFSDIKSLIKGWIDEFFDHNAILSQHDHQLGGFLKENLNQTVYYLESNPTAENIAHHLINEIIPQLLEKHNESSKSPTTIFCSKLRLYETPNCYVDVVK